MNNGSAVARSRREPELPRRRRTTPEVATAYAPSSGTARRRFRAAAAAQGPLQRPDRPACQSLRCRKKLGGARAAAGARHHRRATRTAPLHPLKVPGAGAARGAAQRRGTAARGCAGTGGGHGHRGQGAAAAVARRGGAVPRAAPRRRACTRPDVPHARGARVVQCGAAALAGGAGPAVGRRCLLAPAWLPAAARGAKVPNDCGSKGHWGRKGRGRGGAAVRGAAALQSRAVGARRRGAAATRPVRAPQPARRDAWRVWRPCPMSRGLRHQLQAFLLARTPRTSAAVGAARPAAHKTRCLALFPFGEYTVASRSVLNNRLPLRRAAVAVPSARHAPRKFGTTVFWGRNSQSSNDDIPVMNFDSNSRD